MISPSKVLCYIAILFIVVSLCLAYWKFMIKKDFVVINDVENSEVTQEE